MKTIFINIGEDIVFRNIFTKNFWDKFLSDLNVRVVVLVQKDKKDFFSSRLPSGLIIEEYKRSAPTKFESFFNSLARSGIQSHTNLWSKMRSYKRGDSSFADTLLKRFLAATLGHFNWYKRFLRIMLLRVNSDQNLKNIFDKYNPDMLFATSLSNYDFDVPIAREAKRRGIYIVGMGRSWDNFSSHGLLRVVPNEFLLQNDFLVDMAEKYQAICKSKIPMKVVGLPHYDVVGNLESILEPRERFLSRIGLNSNEKYIIYGAMGTFLFIHEAELPNVFESMIEKGEINCKKILYRAHPKFKITAPDLPYKNIIFDTSGEYVIGAKDGLDDNAYLINSIYHSEIMITGASTMAQDASFLDKPFICVAFNGETKEEDVDFYESVGRFYDLYTHFEDLVKTGNAKIAYSRRQLADYVNLYLENKELDKEGRKAITNRFGYKLDGKSAERIANHLKETINNK